MPLLHRVGRIAPSLLLAAATGLAGAAAAEDNLPAEVRAALARAQVPAEAMAVVVQDVDAPAPLLSWQARRPVNPASLFKLVTTLAGLELLGPTYTWRTPVWLSGPLRDGVLDGSLVIQGQGDPKLVVERLWLLLRRVQQFGVREIRGDIVLDRSAFARAEQAPADFDGEALRPYNVAPDALLLAQRSLVYRFVPDPSRGVAAVGVEPALLGHRVDAEVPLAAGPCDDWRAALKATPADAGRMQFSGRYAAACGEQTWPLAYADPASFDARLLQAMWQALGGQLGGTVREGSAPAGAPAFEWQSPPLAEVVRDINKYSNNVMAQQLFLTLGLDACRHAVVDDGAARMLPGRGQPRARPAQGCAAVEAANGSAAAPAPGSADAARAALSSWLRRVLGENADAIVVDNGSGLSRQQRLSAQTLAALLQYAWHSAVMPELISSLPLVGQDGTLRRRRMAGGAAHLKTGSLRDVDALAGYVLGADGRRRVLVAIIHHPNAGAARDALDLMVQWTMRVPGTGQRR